MEFQAQQIAALLGGKVQGDGSRAVHDVAPVETAGEGQLSFICDAKYLPALTASKAAVVLLSEPLLTLLTDDMVHPDTTTLIVVPNARQAMGQLLQVVAKAINPPKKGIEQPVFISEGVQMPEDAYIGAFTYIGKNVHLGQGVQIYPNCYIGDNVVIGDGSILYAGVKVYYNCQIGRSCILHAGVVVGADGFGFEPDEKGINRKLPQIGNVVIEDDVELGANTCVDRAMMGSTRVKKNAKVDNLVQIAHNVEVGESSFLCAQVGIAGSTTMGDHCVLTGQVGVAGHITIADHCVFGAQSGISSSIKKPGQYQGSPAIDAMRWRRATVGFKQLPEILQDLHALKQQHQPS